MLRRLEVHLLDKRVDGFYVCGASGVGINLPVVGREFVLETVLDQAYG